MAKKRGRPHKQSKLSMAQAVTKTLDLKVKDGVLERDAGSYCYNLLNPAEQRDLGEQECWSRLRDAMKRGRASVHASATMPLPGIVFPGLYAAYALDSDDGGRVVKQTDRLSQLEFTRAMAVRRKQLLDDGAALEAMDRAYQAVKPIWDEQPDLNFGQVCALYQKKRADDAA